MTTCPICGRDGLERFLRIDAVPVMTTQLWDDAEAAASAPRGDLDLAVCSHCGAIRNLAFDGSLVTYTAAFENSQLFSPSFRAYAEQLAEQLVREFGLEDGSVLEVGCGKGEFLEMLCAAGCRRAVGFDPSYGGEVDASPYADRIRIERRSMGPDDVTPASLVVSRHVVEHLEDPLSVLRALRVATGEPAAALYLEVPDVRYVLTPEGMWDLIYPHVSYFSPPSLEVLAWRAGYEPSSTSTAFGDQFLTLRALPGACRDDPEPDRAAVDALLGECERFARGFSDLLERWKVLLDDGARTVLWGAGAKGVSFLNAVAPAGGIDLVVDVNPRKQGSYVPGTGHRVLPPESLPARSPDRAIVMNSQYRDEVASALQEMGVHADVLVA